MRKLIALAAAALLATSCGGPLEPPAASVRGREITMARIRAELEEFTSTPAYRQQAEQGDPASIKRGYEQVTLARLVRRAVLEPEAAELGIEITGADIDARIEDFRADRDLTNDAAFEEFLKEQGVTPEQLRDLAYDALLNERLRAAITGDLAPTEAEVRAEYERRAAEGEYFEERVSHILVDTRRLAERLERELRSLPAPELPGRFAELARRFSKDGGSARKGGDLGYSSGGGLYVEEFQSAIDDLDVGELSAPVRTAAGWHVILVTDRRDEPFEQVRTSLFNQLRNQMQEEAWQDWLVQAYEEADVRVNPRFGRLDARTFAIVDVADAPGAAEPSPAAPAPGGAGG